MSYAPRSLSYSDGLDDGARRERSRIVSLIMDKHYRTIDIYDTAILDNFTDLLEAISNQGETDAN